MGDAAGGVPGLADRLNRLFATVSRPDGRGRWTNEQVAATLRADGPGVSDAYLSQLRNGKRNNPSARNLAAIAGLFGVPMAYFFDQETAGQLDDDLPLLDAVRDRAVRALVLRAEGLSPASIASLIVFIDQARKLEGLPQISGNKPHNQSHRS